MNYLRTSSVFAVITCFPGALFSADAGKQESLLQASYYVTNTYEHTHDDVTVEVTRLTADESKTYLNADYRALGYAPILVSICNNSGDQLLLRGSAIQLPLQTRQDMAHAAHYDTFMWTSLSGYTAFLFFWPAVVPVAIGGSYMAWTNSTVSKKVYSLGFEHADALEILPYDRIEKVLFVRESEMVDSFFLYLYNVSKKEFIPFAVSFMHIQYSGHALEGLQDA